jgi:hypothetical protein
MIMGGVYLTYSAYFLSVDFINIYYIIMLCSGYIDEMVEGEPNIMHDSLVLKRRMLK